MTMQITPIFTSPVELQADWLIVPVFEDSPLPSQAETLDGALRGAISRLRQTGDISGKANELTPLLEVSGISAKRVLVVGLGKREKADRPALVSAAAAAARHVTGKQIDCVAMIV